MGFLQEIVPVQKIKWPTFICSIYSTRLSVLTHITEQKYHFCWYTLYKCPQEKLLHLNSNNISISF